MSVRDFCPILTSPGQVWNEWKVKFIFSENSICELATRDYTTGLVNKSRRPGLEQTPAEYLYNTGLLRDKVSKANISPCASLS
jgi:hypothetical protein